MFKLMEVSIGSFVIVKQHENTSRLPIKAHGFIEIFSIANYKYVVNVSHKMSEALKKSGELERLEKEALRVTKEAVADELKY